MSGGADDGLQPSNTPSLRTAPDKGGLTLSSSSKAHIGPLPSSHASNEQDDSALDSSTAPLYTNDPVAPADAPTFDGGRPAGASNNNKRPPGSMSI